MTSFTSVVRSGRTTEKRGGGSETRSRGGTNKELTEDLVVEILARLPVKSLLRFKSVSKGWYSLIISPNFISKHTTHHSRNTVVLFRRYSCSYTVSRNTVVLFRRYYSCIQTVTDDYDYGGGETTLSFLFGEDRVEQVKFVYHSKWILHIKMVGGCLNGVVCFSLSQLPQSYALWNPATRQVRLIPGGNSEHFYYGSGFCFDPVTNSFKVVRVNLEGGEITALVDVFSTATNSWTLREVALPYPIIPFREAECVNGYMHWHMGWELEERYILRYNITEEVFQRLELPSPRRHASVSENYHLSDYKGSLAMFVYYHHTSSEIDVWLLNDSGGGANHSCWSKLLSCKPSVSVSSVRGFFRKDDTEFIILRDHPDCSFYLYDPQNGETRKYWNEEPLWETLPYSESLASLE